LPPKNSYDIELENEMLNMSNRENIDNINILINKNDELSKINYQKDENIHNYSSKIYSLENNVKDVNSLLQIKQFTIKELEERNFELSNKLNSLN
jgi:hypothetical protein